MSVQQNRCLHAALSKVHVHLAVPSHLGQEQNHPASDCSNLCHKPEMRGYNVEMMHANLALLTEGRDTWSFKCINMHIVWDLNCSVS